MNAARIFHDSRCETARAHTLLIEESGHVAKHERHRKGQQVGRENRSLGGCQAAQVRVRGIETIDSEL
jgi:hypothetical protein